MSDFLFDSRSALSRHGAELLLQDLTARQESHWCLATGASPEGVYSHISRKIGSQGSKLWVTKLDEWVGMDPAAEGACESYLQKHVLEPWSIAPEKYLAFDGLAPDPVAECRRVAHELSVRPRLDWCVLGVGVNGHLGLNEPAETLSPVPHLSTLAETTRDHPMLGDTAPTHGITMGLGAFFSSRHVLLLFVGKSKADAYEAWKEGVVTTQCPVTMLHLHPRVDCLVCLD